MTDRTATKKPETKKIPAKWIALWAAAAALFLAVCIVFLGMSGGDTVFPVVISEILPSNSSYPNASGKICDYIELQNTAEYPVDLSGFRLGDLAGENRYAIPEGTVLGPGEFLVIWCDSKTEDPACAPFGISRSGGEVFCLIADNGAVAHRVTTLAAGTDEAMIRLSDGSWILTDRPTPGAANDTEISAMQDVYNSGVSSVRITEYSAAGNGYHPLREEACDWVELFNTGDTDADLSGYILSDNVGNDKFAFSAGTVLPGGARMVILCMEDAEDGVTAPFALSGKGGEELVLKTPDGRVVELLTTAAMDSGSCILTERGWETTQQLSPGFANTAEGHERYLESIGADPGRVVISEVMSGEQYLLSDGLNSFSDWVELYNSGDVPVDLSGWTLTDDAGDEDKWRFSSFVLEAGERAVVFCSGKGTVTDAGVHTDFGLSASGETLLLTSSAGTQVDFVSFGRAEPNCSFVPGADGEMQLCRIPTPGYANDEEGYEAFCAASVPAGPIAIWEVMTANTEYLPQALGECYDWVELKNISDETVMLSRYAMTDDADAAERYVLPNRTLAPGETLCIILSGDPSLSTDKYAHAPFALNGREDTLLLYETDGTLADHAVLRQIPPGMSFGRSRESGGFFYMEPTPNGENLTGHRLISAAPVSEILPGVYTGDEPVAVPLEAKGTIYYTTDGSDPDADSFLYSEPIPVRETTVLRAAAIEDGKLRSEIWTATFVIGGDHTIPVFSLVTDPSNLWGGTGIYQNLLEIKEERRGATVSYCGEDGSFSTDCEISLHGMTTVTAFSKKSFCLRFRECYDGALQYDLFEDGEVTAFSSLLLRAAHESSQSTHMHDVIMADVAAEACDTVISQKYKYVALYLNGEYWGLYALREDHSPKHYASYMDVPAESVVVQRYAIDPEYSLYDLYHFCQQQDISDAENYAFLESQMDMTSFIDWIILEAYSANFDINANMRYYYSSADGKWRCGLVDLDLGMCGYADFGEVVHTFHHGVFVSNLVRNSTFRESLALRLAELLEGPLSDESMLGSIDRIADMIRDEMPAECERWNYEVFVWESFVDDMRLFCDGRSAEMISTFCSELNVTPQEQEAWFGHLTEA